MSPQFRVTLTKEEVEELQKISSTGSRSAKIVLFARALLLLDKGPHTTEHWTVNQTSKAVGLSERTLNHLKEKFLSQGLDAIIRPRPTGKSKRPVIFDGAFEAKLTQLACSEPPEGGHGGR
ncbi:helix-turn-helix domain-containing protein [Parasutterella sp.]|uniref:helix-turn-helix domain-containing protein n=1 Tax=Parasutterella sp. TaxID=2049037 RepID=UPI0039921E13